MKKEYIKPELEVLDLRISCRFMETHSLYEADAKEQVFTDEEDEDMDKDMFSGWED